MENVFHTNEFLSLGKENTFYYENTQVELDTHDYD